LLDKSTVKSIVLFIIINVISYIIHRILASGIVFVGEVLIDVSLSYTTNTVFSFLVCIGAYFVHQVFKSQTGFVYLGLSLVKMVLLYAILYPHEYEGTLSQLDKFNLLIPFGINLVLEQMYVVKLLKLVDLSKTQ